MERIQISIPDASAQMRLLVHRAQFDPDEDEREAARGKLRELASDWRGYPGQRRRGDLPQGVEIR